jgi:hypothetical protein
MVDFAILAAACAGLVWWLKPGDQLSKGASAPSKASVPIAPSLPVVKPVFSKATAQAELKAAMTDIISIIQAGDLAAYNAVSAPPSKLAQAAPEIRAQNEQSLQIILGNPAQRRAVVASLQSQMLPLYQSLQNIVPIFNDAGDEATYTVVDPNSPTGVPLTVVFLKENGRWYIYNRGAGGL